MLATICLAVSLFPPLAFGAQNCGFQNGLGTFSFVNPPSDCWRPYNDDSPFNREIPEGAPALASSAKYSHTMANAHESDLEVFGDDGRDGGIAVYWSQPTDPIYELRCMKRWGRCAIEGLKIRVPAAAKPAGGDFAFERDMDAHMTIVDQGTGMQYDLWNVTRKDPNGGIIEFGWGGKTRIDGDGLGSDAIAARYGSLAGIIRPAELVAGKIDHALLIGVPCTETYVYPATKTGLTCTQAGLDPRLYPPMGARMQLDLTAAQIERLGLPSWKKAIVTALARYGAYVSDTTGSADAWGFEYESGVSQKSFGRPDPWAQWASSLGVQPKDYNRNGQPEYWIEVYSNIPWEKMRFVSECAALNTCPPAPPKPAAKVEAQATVSSVATIRYEEVRQTTIVKTRNFNNRIRICRKHRNRLARKAAKSSGAKRVKLKARAKHRSAHCIKLRTRKQNQLVVHHRKLARLSARI